MIYHVTLGGRTLVVEVEGPRVTVDGEPFEIALGRVQGGPLRSLLVGGASHTLAAERRGAGRWRMHIGARVLDAEVVDERTRVIREMTGGGAAALGPRPVHAPMPGMVVRVEVEEGDRVEAGQGVVIVEAMKMENELVAEGPGVVERVHVRQGEPVEKDQLLVDFAAIEEDGGA